MTHALTLSLLVALALNLATPSHAQPEGAPAKRALVIAIGNYPQPRFGGPSYSVLNAINDTSLVAPALRRHGFAVTTLTDAEATRDGMRDAFLALGEAAQPGDIVFVHYSGHGHQVTDASGDEPDGYDEMLVPYDAPAGPPDGYLGEGHLLDDELGEVVEALRRAVYPGGEVVFTFDACHSGSGTRGEMPTRTGGAPIGPPGSSAHGGADRRVVGVDAPLGTRGDGDAPGLAPYVFISAAAHDQLDQEMRDPETGTVVGPLSYAVGHTLARLGEGESYRRLFERIEHTFATFRPNQTPQAEGSLDTEVFSGLAVAQQPYVPVVSVQATGEVIVDGGSLIGLTEGSRLAFYPAGTQRPESEPLAEGIVSATTPYQALVAFDSALAVDLSGSWAFVTWQALGDVRVAVALKDGLLEGAAIRAALDGVGIVRIVEGSDAPDDRVEVVDDGTALVLRQAGDGAVLHRLPRGDGRAVADRLSAYARGRYLQRLSLSHPDLSVRLDVHPADLSANAFGQCSPTEANVVAGARTREADRPENVFRPGETYALRVTNTGYRPAHVAIVSIRPGGEMGKLYPLGGAQDNVVAPGASFLLPNCYIVGADDVAGPDVLKVFITDQPLDLTLLVDGPAAPTRSGGKGLLDDLFSAAYLDVEALGEGMRSGTVGGAPSLATTTEVVLQIERPDGQP